MSLKEKINEDLKSAIKTQNQARLDTLRSIRAEILKMDKSGMNREMTPEEEIDLLKKQSKMRKESIEIFEKAGRTDLVEREKLQLEIINEYLPAQLPEDEVLKILDKIISGFGEVTEKDFGKIMGAAMKELKGKAEGKFIQDVVRKNLGMNQ
ncbi:MAG: GatB/YqeY domain-containing protein [Ignavibacteria bacterium]|nr:GatB/YqeY domain-containing protein [Ignavibacteria bacterium]